MEMTELIHLWQKGDKISEERLFSASYQKFKDIARLTMSQHGDRNITLEKMVHSTTTLVHEAYIKLNSSVTHDIANRREFYLLVSKSIRHILVDIYRKKTAQKRDLKNVEKYMVVNKKIPFSTKDFEQYLNLEQSIDHLHQQYPRTSEILQLRHFLGLLNKEIASFYSISESTVDKELKFARGWIKLNMLDLH